MKNQYDTNDFFLNIRAATDKVDTDYVDISYENNTFQLEHCPVLQVVKTIYN